MGTKKKKKRLFLANNAAVATHTWQKFQSPMKIHPWHALIKE